MGENDREGIPASQKMDHNKEPEMGKLWYLRIGAEHWSHQKSITFNVCCEL